MPIVSIRQSLSAFDQLQERVLACSSLQSQFFEVLREHTLELDSSAADELRRAMRSLSGRLRRGTEDWDFAQTGADFERSWREYYSRSWQAHQRLEEELAATMRVLGETLAELDTTPPDGPEALIESQVGLLNSLSEVAGIEAMRAGLKQCVAQLSECLEALRRERAVLVTQLRDEIRTLQGRLLKVEECAAADYVTGLVNRREMERLVMTRLDTGKSFSLIYIWLRNFKHLERELPRTMADQLVSLTSSEVRQVLPEGTALARWSDDEICGLVDSEKPASMKMTRDLSASLNTHFLLHARGVNARTITLKAQVGMVQSQSEENAERFFYRSDKLIKAIQGTA